jgi:hypothetical protein
MALWTLARKRELHSRLSSAGKTFRQRVIQILTCAGATKAMFANSLSNGSTMGQGFVTLSLLWAGLLGGYAGGHAGAPPLPPNACKIVTATRVKIGFEGLEFER